MTNKEKYKMAFSAVCISDGFSLEVEKMKKIKKVVDKQKHPW